MTESPHDDYDYLTSVLTWPDAAIYFAPVGTPLPLTASDPLPPPFSKLQAELYWRLPNLPWRSRATPMTAFAAWLQRALEAERAAQAKAVNVVHWKPAPKTYDDWWFFLGLPDVRAEVERRNRELARLELDRQITATWTAVRDAAQPAIEHLSQAILSFAAAFAPFVDAMGNIGSTPRHPPPMWAVDPTKSRRPR